MSQLRFRIVRFQRQTSPSQWNRPCQDPQDWHMFRPRQWNGCTADVSAMSVREVPLILFFLNMELQSDCLNVTFNGEDMLDLWEILWGLLHTAFIRIIWTCLDIYSEYLVCWLSQVFLMFVLPVDSLSCYHCCHLFCFIFAGKSLAWKLFVLATWLQRPTFFEFWPMEFWPNVVECDAEWHSRGQNVKAKSSKLPSHESISKRYIGQITDAIGTSWPFPDPVQIPNYKSGLNLNHFSPFHLANRRRCNDWWQRNRSNGGALLGDLGIADCDRLVAMLHEHFIHIKNIRRWRLLDIFVKSW